MLGAQITYSNGMEPYVEFDETEEGIVLTAEIPGVRPDNVKVRVCDDEVRVEIMENGMVAYSEVFESDRIDPKQAKIQFRNGILVVRAPYMNAVF
jgi:HSP20 family molecular chaperone IbpA